MDLKIAIIAVGDDAGEERPFHLDVVSKIETTTLPAHVTVIAGEMSPLRTLEMASAFDGLIIVDRACMGEEPGTAKTFDLNDLVLGKPPSPVTLLGFKIDSELLFAQKYLGLPRTKIVCIETGSCGKTPSGEPGGGRPIAEEPPGAEAPRGTCRPLGIAHYQEVLRKAVEELIR